MGNRVSAEDIKKINEIYFQTKSYAETARQTGWSAATVRRYVDKNYSPINENNIRRFNPDTDLPVFSTQMFESIICYGDLCVLNGEELDEIMDMWEEIEV